jgi:hypothetical protein
MWLPVNENSKFNLFFPFTENRSVRWGAPLESGDNAWVGVLEAYHVTLDRRTRCSLRPHQLAAPRRFEPSDEAPPWYGRHHFVLFYVFVADLFSP